MDDKINELFEQLLEEGYTLEQAADLACSELNEK